MKKANVSVFFFMALCIELGCLAGEFSMRNSDYDSPDGKWGVGFSVTEPEPDDADLKRRILRSPVHVLINAKMPKEQILEVLLRNRDKWVVSFDDRGAYLNYKLIDYDRMRRFGKWTNEEAPKYMIPSPIGAYKTGSAQLGGEVASQSWTTLAVNSRKLALQDFTADKGKGAFVVLGTDFDPTASDRMIHDIFGRHICEGFEIVRKGDSTVIETQKGYYGKYMVSWLAKDVFISITAPSAQHEPNPVITAYLARYPSILPKDLTFDVQAWAIKQLEMSIALMKDAIEEPDRNLSARGAPYRFTWGKHGFSPFACSEWWGRHNWAEGQLYGKYLKQDPQDFEAYRKGLIEARTKTVAEAEEMLKIARAEGVRFVQVKPDERRVQIGRTPEDIEREKREKKQQVLLISIGYYGGGGIFVLLLGYVLFRLRALRTRPPKINAMVLGI